MADVSVKMGVSGISQFKQGINQAQASVKSFDAALKLNEKQLKATGDAETYLQNKTAALQGKMNAQKSAIANAEAALKALKDSGVSPLSTAYQNLQRQMLEAQSGLLDTEQELQQVGTETADVAGKTDQLAASLGGLNKTVSLDQVRGAIGNITNAMEQAAKKAVDLGKELWDTIMDAASRADDTATMAEMYGIDLQTFKKMQALVAGGLDTTVEAMLTAQDKMKKGIGKGTKEVIASLKELGVSMYELTDTGGGILEFVEKDPEKVFWEAGKAILAMSDAFDKEAAAQALFGRSWKELIPLFNSYEGLEDYNQALEDTKVNSEESTKNLAELYDTVGELQQKWTSLKDEILGAVAEPLTKAADALSGLLGNVLEYLQTPEGQKALKEMGEAVGGLFEDLGKIDPEQVVQNFTEVFDKIVDGLKWLNQNRDTLKNALKVIVGGWGLAKLSGGALDVLKLVNGLNSLRVNGMPNLTGTEPAGGTAGAAAAAAGAASTAGAGVTAALNSSLGGGAAEKLANGATSKFGMYTLASLMLYPTVDAVISGEMGENMKRLKEQQELLNEYREVAQGLKPKTDWRSLFGWGGGGSQEAEVEITPKVDEGAAEETWEEMLERLGMTECEIEVEEIELPDDAAEQVAEQVGTVTLPGQIIIGEDGIIYGNGGGSSGGHGFANGLPYVPFDGFHAVLHKGERVVPAREVGSSRNFSSNLYVESMVMNNGQDADGLAAAMAAAQRRTMSGFGS